MPVLRLSGSATGLNQPTGVVTDVNGVTFVANPGNNSITKYPPGVTGNVAPAATIVWDINPAQPTAGRSA